MICINCKSEVFCNKNILNCKCDYNHITLFIKSNNNYFLLSLDEYSFDLNIYKFDYKSNIARYFYTIDKDDISISNLEKFFDNLIFT